VFQLPQLGQRPIQRGLVSPQLEQTYTVFNFGSFILAKLLRFVCVIHLSVLSTFYHAFHPAASKTAAACAAPRKAAKTMRSFTVFPKLTLKLSA
jgi:hypothetical protein